MQQYIIVCSQKSDPVFLVKPEPASDTNISTRFSLETNTGDSAEKILQI